jgi:SAM-dependent methyltransferase
MRNVAPYSVLAAGYDVVMEHVPYEEWAGYVHGLITDYSPEARTVLELGCGTGSFALALARMAPYRYAATDGSETMLGVARGKAEMEGADIQFSVVDFTDFRLERPVDVVVLLYDGLNYLTESQDLERLFACAHAALTPGGVFIFDQSTPANSINNEAFFEDSGEAEGFRYRRSSSFDRETGLHSTVFEFDILGETYREEHVQRAYTLSDVRNVAEKAAFRVEGTFDDFSRDQAGEGSERIHWVVRPEDS